MERGKNNVRPPMECVARRTRSHMPKVPELTFDHNPSDSDDAFSAPPKTKRRVTSQSARTRPTGTAAHKKKNDVKDQSAAVEHSPEFPMPPLHLIQKSAATSSLQARQSMAIANHMHRLHQKNDPKPVVHHVPVPTASTSSSNTISRVPRLSYALRGFGPLNELNSNNNNHHGSLLPSKSNVSIKRGVQMETIEIGQRTRTYSLLPSLPSGPTAAVRASSLVNFIQPPHLHKILNTLYGPIQLNIQPNLQSRGVNRELSWSFGMNVMHPVELLVRFTKVNGLPQDQEYHPRNLEVVINGFDVTKLEIIDHKITGSTKLYSPIELPGDHLALVNTLNISWTVDNSAVPPEDYYMFVQRAHRLSTDILLSEISSKRIVLEEAIRRAVNLLTQDEDGISLGSSDISLICTLSRKRASNPVRGRECRHLECFDAESFLQLNASSKAKWHCPICVTCVGVRDLVVDEFIVDLMDFTKQDNVNIASGKNNAIIVSESKKTKPSVVHVTDVMDESVIILD